MRALKSPARPIAEDHNLVALSDGSLYSTYRTIQGNPCHAYSRDGGHTWTPPSYATYSPGGRRIKHPRAACFVRPARRIVPPQPGDPISRLTVAQV